MPIDPSPIEPGRPMPAPAPPVRVALAALRQAVANDGIRRLGVSWTLGIAADSALTVVSLVTVFNRGGVVAAGLVGAVRLIPAVIAGMISGSLVERFRGDRILVAVGILRALGAALAAFAIISAGPTMADHQVTMVILFVAAAIAGAAGAPVRPTQVTLMPAIARSPAELVAANTAWSTGEGLGAFAGPLVAGLLMAANFHGAVAVIAAVAFLATAAISAGLRFEQASDASGGRASGRTGFRIVAGIHAIRARPVLTWAVIGVYGQVITRGLLNALVVVAAIDLLGMGQSGPGLLSAALGVGGLIGVFLAMSSTRSERLVRMETLGLVFWGLPLAAIGVAPLAQVALIAMIVIGVANATYDVALFTILQRGSTNDDRAAVLSALEAAIGLGGVTGSLLAPVFLIALGPRGALIASGSILPIVAALMTWRIGGVQRITVVDEGTVRLLRMVPAFAALPMTAVERVAIGLVPFTSPAGTALMRQGELGDTFHVIESGEIEVLVDDRVIDRLGPGAGVGEIALLRRGPRTATVRAVTDVTGYTVDAATFCAAVAGPAAAAVTERMAETYVLRAGSTP